MKGLKQNQAKFVLWISGFVSFLAFALVGGYVFVSSENEELKKETKKVFLVSLIFICIEAVLSVVSACMGLAGTYSKTYSIIRYLLVIAKVVVFAIFACIALFEKEESENQEGPAETKVITVSDTTKHSKINTKTKKQAKAENKTEESSKETEEPKAE